MAAQAPAGWYVDPFGRHEHRHWDGFRWTEHVATGGQQSVDAPATPSGDPSWGASRPPGWYADPGDGGVQRYWDGGQWTGQIAVPVPTSPPADQAGAGRPPEPPKKKRGVAKQVERANVPGSALGPGEGTLATEQVLVFNQKGRVLRSTSEYAIFRQDGVHLGTIEEVGLDLAAKLGARAKGTSERNREHRYRIVDTDGRLVLQMARSATGWFGTKGQLRVEGPAGPIGLIRQQSTGVVGQAIEVAGYLPMLGAPRMARRALGGVKGLAAGAAVHGAAAPVAAAADSLADLGRARFALEAGGRNLGSILNRGSDEKDFSIRDGDGVEIGRITRTWAGWAKEQFTKADHYVLVLDRSVDEPLRSLVLAAALAIDVELRQ